MAKQNHQKNVSLFGLLNKFWMTVFYLLFVSVFLFVGGCTAVPLPFVSSGVQSCFADSDCGDNQRCFHHLCLSEPQKEKKAERRHKEEPTKYPDASLSERQVPDASPSERQVPDAPKEPNPDRVPSAKEEPNPDQSSSEKEGKHPDSCVAKKEICDGKDNDCDGLVDEDLNAPLCSKQAGVCKDSEKICDGVRGWIDCSDREYQKHNAAYQPNETACDGKDNNCDGKTDLQCECKNGETKPCGTDQGECKKGIRRCVNYEWSNTCEGSITPAIEICDGKDNNCDGKIDEGVRFYRDSDYDGYGDPGKSSCQDSYGFVKNKDDCDDDNRNVSPKQSQFSSFSRPFSTSYDYNCDGKEEKRYTKKANCPSNCKGIVFSFKKGAISCGARGLFLLTCSKFMGKCRPIYVTKIQECL